MSAVTITHGVAPGVLLSDPPILRTTPSPNGLFSTTVDPEFADVHWVNSVLYEHQACAAVSGISGTCESWEGLPRVNDVNNATTAAASAFHLYASHSCGSAVGHSLEEFHDYAKRALDTHEQEAVEAAISGALHNATPNFRDAVTLNPGADAVSIKYGFGLLADYAASVFGGPGAVIHAPRVISGFSADLNLATGAVINTITGEKVAFGGGYTNESPDGVTADPGSAWLYVTPPVFFAKGNDRDFDTRSGSGFNRDDNDLTMHAERTYLVGWDNCPVGAVLVEFE